MRGSLLTVLELALVLVLPLVLLLLLLMIFSSTTLYRMYIDPCTSLVHAHMRYYFCSCLLLP